MSPTTIKPYLWPKSKRVKTETKILFRRRFTVLFSEIMQKPKKENDRNDSNLVFCLSGNNLVKIGFFFSIYSQLNLSLS